jgi:hypothetical protein
LEDTTIEDVLKTVEDLYVQKDYQKALSVLEANQSKMGSGLWHYNVGTVYGKLQNWPLARFHLMMADQAGLSSKDVLTNKDLVESQLDIKRLEKPLSPHDYFTKASIEASQGILTTVSLLLVIMGLVSFWRKSSVKALGIFLFLVIGVMSFNFWVHTWKRSIVIQAQSIQDGPSAIFGAREELPVGVMLITNRKGDWLEIIYPSRFHGWIKDAGLKELK